MLRTKAWSERGVSSFLSPQLRREGGETLVLREMYPNGIHWHEDVSKLQWDRKTVPRVSLRQLRRYGSGVPPVRRQERLIPSSLAVGVCATPKPAEPRVRQRASVRPRLDSPTGNPEKNHRTRRLAPRTPTMKWLIEDGRVRFPSRPLK